MYHRINKIYLSLFVIGFSLPVWGRIHTVIVSSNSFSPSVVVIQAGDTVRWINDGTGSHNIYSVGRFRCAEGCDAIEGGNGDPSAEQWQAEVTFRIPGTIPYECQPHVQFGMVGTVVVEAPDESVVQQIDATIDNQFLPSEITIEAGQFLHVLNQGGVHNFRTADDSLICADGCENDGTIVDTDPSGFPWEIYVRMNSAGIYPFYCANPEHMAQTGVLTVLSDAIFVNGFE
ncbi:MAG: plastocyanin/azurin family copper-binding protein [Marinicella sp.]